MRQRGDGRTWGGNRSLAASAVWRGIRDGAVRRGVLREDGEGSGLSSVGASGWRTRGRVRMRRGFFRGSWTRPFLWRRSISRFLPLLRFDRAISGWNWDSRPEPRKAEVVHERLARRKWLDGSLRRAGVGWSLTVSIRFGGWWGAGKLGMKGGFALGALGNVPYSRDGKVGVRIRTKTDISGQVRSRVFDIGLCVGYA